MQFMFAIDIILPIAIYWMEILYENKKIHYQRVCKCASGWSCLHVIVQWWSCPVLLNK